MNDSEGEPIVGYLVYSDFDTALERANTEGEDRNLPHFTGTGASRYITYPQELSDGTWALEIDNYLYLTPEEIATIVPTVTFKPYAQDS